MVNISTTVLYEYEKTDIKPGSNFYINLKNSFKDVDLNWLFDDTQPVEPVETKPDESKPFDTSVFDRELIEKYQEADDDMKRGVNKLLNLAPEFTNTAKELERFKNASIAQLRVLYYEAKLDEAKYKEQDRFRDARIVEETGFKIIQWIEHKQKLEAEKRLKSAGKTLKVGNLKR